MDFKSFLFIFLIFVPLFRVSLGDFGNPPIIDIGAENVTIINQTIPLIEIQEEMNGTVRTKIAEINVTNSESTVTKIGPTNPIWKYLDIIKEDEKFYFILIGQIDADGPDGVSPLQFDIRHDTSLIIGNVKFVDINENAPEVDLPFNQILLKENCFEDCVPDINFLRILAVLPLNALECQDSEYVNSYTGISRQENSELEIMEVVGTDADRDAIPLIFIIEEIGPPTNPYYEFIQVPIEGVKNQISLRMSSPHGFDYETETIHRLRITTSDGEKTSFQQILTINIEDQNDMPPIFRSLPSFQSVPENKPIAEPILKLEAVDGDSGIQDKILYDILEVNGDPENLQDFNLNPETGELFFTTEMDADSLDVTEFVLKVRAYEQLEPHFEVVENITVSLQDINDLPPLFMPEGIDEKFFDPITIFEGDCQNSVPNCFTGNSILEFSIKDGDKTIQNSRYTVELVYEPQFEFIQEFISVQSISGSGSEETNYTLRIIKSIDFENTNWQQTVNFQIHVNEVVGEEKSIGYVTLTIEDVNDHFPIFEGLDETSKEFIVNVFENISMGSSIIIPGFGASDLDISPDFGMDSIIFNWSSNSRPPPLDIDSVNGAITVNREGAFDFESIPEEVFVIEAIDNNGQGNRVSAVLRVKVEDVNDQIPVLRLNASRTSILENITDFTLPVDITATDIDTNAQLETYLTFENSPEEVSKWFVIQQETIDDSNGHQIQARIVNGEIPTDREFQERVEITVWVVDRNGIDQEEQKVSVLLIVEIQDKNDETPEFVEDYENEIYNVVETLEFPGGIDPENEFKRIIYTFRARDNDLNNNLTFTIESEYEGMVDLVELDSDQDRAILRRAYGKMIDREYQQFYQGDTDFLKFNLFVTDSVNTNNVSIQISVIDINDNTPVWADCPKQYSIKENTIISTQISECYANDLDKSSETEKFGLVNYIFSDQTIDGRDQFQIDLDTGVLSSIENATIDRESKSSYTIVMRAIDYYREGSTSGSNFEDLFIQIDIIDVNDVAPLFLTESTVENPLIEAQESVPNNGYIFSENIIIMDGDEEKTNNSWIEVNLVDVSCTECSGENIGDPMSLFELVIYERGDNNLTVRIKTLDSFEGKYGKFILKINASDNPDQEDEQKFTIKDFHINILDENGNDPIFTFPTQPMAYRVVLSHEVDQPIKDKFGNQIPRIVAIDADNPLVGNGQIILSLDNFEDFEFDVREYFSIRPVPGSNAQGDLTLIKSLEENNGDIFKIKLIATDRGEPEARFDEREISIAVVMSVNQEPFFDVTFENVTFKENVTDSENQFNLPIAVDLDFQTGNNETGEMIIYRILEGPDSDKFQLNILEANGQHVLTTNGSLDRETIDHHEIIIFVSNYAEGNENAPNPTPEQFLYINITVEDIIDTAPYFLETDLVNDYLSGGILNTHSSNSEIKTIQVYDVDLNDTIRYEITSEILASHDSINQIPNPFFLEPETGILRITFTPTPIMQGYFTFNISAYDSIELEAFAPCRIYLVQQDVHAAQFVFSNGITYVEERKSLLSETLTLTFQNKSQDILRCNIDRIELEPGQVAQLTVVKTHFIDQENRPMPSNVINSMLFDPVFLNQLFDALGNITLNYQVNAGGDLPSESDDNDILIYGLIGVVSVLGFLISIIIVVSYFKTTSLQRKVRALTASAFGSQQSGMNRAGAGDMPGSNVHADAGSNPVWQFEDSKIGFNDNESIGSGGSVLIGVEDDEDFKNYTNEYDKSDKNNMMNTNVVSNGRKNPLFQEDDDGNEEEESDENGNHQQSDPTFDDFPIAPIVRRNPLTLMRLDESGEDEA